MQTETVTFKRWSSLVWPEDSLWPVAVLRQVSPTDSISAARFWGGCDPISDLVGEKKKKGTQAPCVEFYCRRVEFPAVHGFPRALPACSGDNHMQHRAAASPHCSGFLSASCTVQCSKLGLFGCLSICLFVCLCHADEG